MSDHVNQWFQNNYQPDASKRSRQEHFSNSSGFDLKPLYGQGSDHPDDLPGHYPFTRGIRSTMYRGQLWTMRQYAGFTSAEESNQRYHYLLKQGQTGLSVAFDLPTQIGYDSDDPMSEGEVGKVGVPISTLDDMGVLMRDIPLQEVSVSMTINATASILLAMLMATAKAQGLDPAQVRGTVQNDILKEYIARGTYRFPEDPSLRITTDLFAWCRDHAPRFNTISISGYHIREAGATAVQEVAFTLADGIAYVEAALKAGLDVDDFAGRLSFFFNAHNNLFEEIAKFRAARRLWAKIMKQRFKAKKERSMMLRFHTQVAGSTLASSQIDNNIVRVTVQALAAVLGGTQSLHTNARDEALALPTESSVRTALRTQQILAHESGVADVIDPLGGAPYIEELTAEVEARAQSLIDDIDQMGGAVEAIKQGFQQRQIRQAAYEVQKAIETGEQVVVGVNRFQSDDAEQAELFKIDPAVAEARKKELAAFKAARDGMALEGATRHLEEVARGSDNIMAAIFQAVEQKLTLGEICFCLEKVFGQYTPRA